MKALLKVTAIILMFFASNISLGQGVFSKCPDYTLDIRKIGSQSTITIGGLKQIINCNPLYIYEIGKNGSTRKRGIYQWNLSEIPDGSTINSIMLEFDFSVINYNECNLKYFNVDFDITSQNLNLDDLYNATHYDQTGIGYGFGSPSTSYVISTTFTGTGDAFIVAFTNALNQDRFTLGAAWRYDGPSAGDAEWYLNPRVPTLVVNYTPPNQLVTIDQRNNNNVQVGVLKKWEESNWGNNFNPGTSFNFPVHSEQTILGDQTVIGNQKYNNWNFDKSDVRNHHTFTITSEMSELTSRFEPTYSSITIKNSLEGTTTDGGQIEFRDPWFLDYPDPSFGFQPRNRGMNDAIYYQRPSPFNPTNGGQYKGVFLNQSGPNVNWQGAYYKVGMPTEQTISINGQNRKFFPYKWQNDGGVTFQNESTFESPRTGVVFTSSNATATAILKGQLMSNDQNGVKNPSQKKMVRTDNGQYHVVYESMGTVWYTYSLTSDFYGAWGPEEQLHYLGKNPAIDYDGNKVTIVFEEYNPQVGGNAKIHLYTYGPSGNGYYEPWIPWEEVTSYPSSYYGNAKPVVSYTQWEIFIAYRTGPTGGIKQKTLWIEYSWSTETDIPGTNGDCKNPTVTGRRGPGASVARVYIAYENFGTIFYRQASRIDTIWQYIAAPINLSALSGFTLNRYPVISLSDKNSANIYLMVSWQGIYDANPTNPLPKTDGTKPLSRKAAVVKTGYDTNWGTTSSFNNNVDYTSNGSLNTAYGSIMSWSESDGQYSKYVRRRNATGYDPITPVTPNGIHTLISNGSEFGNVKAMVFDKSTNAPYMLNWCTNDFTYIPDGMGKISESGIVDISFGRSGIVEKNSIEFVFNIGDVLLNGETIKFIERADTLPVTSIEELNLSVRTDTLNLNAESELIFSDYYYVVNSEKADSLLSNEFNVNFKCELVKLSTGEAVGVFEEVNFNKTNLEEYGQEGYLIDCSGIEAGEYYLRLTSSVNEEVGLSLSDIQMDNVLLEKAKLNVRNFKGSSIPLEYALEQNYPNPFNPTTTISYQLPKDGMVTLKVYDILGAEVATLVNEEKIAGKYEVNFNARKLASGVYIYRLQASDYISVKKMMLLK